MKNRIINKVYDGLFGWSATEGGGGNSPGGGGSTGGGGGGSSDEGWIGDGNTHIWITLHEGRTSPMLGVCPNGTVTADWGDGTTPDTLTGTSVSTEQWTPTHNYAEPGDYVISLTVDGKMGFNGSSSSNQRSCLLRYDSSADARNAQYRNAIKKIECGNSVTSISQYAFSNCYSLASISIPESVTSIGNEAFNYCYSLASISIPEGVTSIGNDAFANCYSLASISISEGVTSISQYAFSNCYSLTSVSIQESVTSIGKYAFGNCYSLASITIPDSVTSIGDSAFRNCYGMKFYDFTKHTAVPTLSSTNSFNGIPDDCKIRVPAALYDEWIAATNWSTYASNIVAV